MEVGRARSAEGGRQVVPMFVGLGTILGTPELGEAGLAMGRRIGALLEEQRGDLATRCTRQASVVVLGERVCCAALVS